MWYNGKKKRPGCIRSPGIHLTTFYENSLRLNRIALSKKSDSAEHPSQTAYVLEKSLVSKNPLVRILALLDRRLGKRRLLALEESMEQELDWVRAFYVIRMQAEGLMEKE